MYCLIIFRHQTLKRRFGVFFVFSPRRTLSKWVAVLLVLYQFHYIIAHLGWLK